MSGPKVRVAVPADIPQIIGIEMESETAAHWPAEEYARIFDPNTASRIALVAEAEEQLAGFIVIRCIDKEWELENIAVKSSFRRQGLGRILLENLLVLARKSRTDRVFLEVRQSNLPARCLYSRLGFLETGVRRGYYSHPIEDAVTYEIVTEI